MSRQTIGGRVMNRNKIFAAVGGLCLLLVFGSVAFSQTAIVRGVVKAKQADGTEVPVAGALVEPYRVDVQSGKAPSTKTNRRGEFNFVGFGLAYKYVLAVSGEGIAPTVYQNVRAGMEDISILVVAGDGKVYTEAEVRSLASQTAPSLDGKNAEQLKKEEEEYQKQLEKYNAEKAKAENVNKIVNAALKDGDAAFKSKNYDLAISKFDEGINADPEFEGSAPVLLNYKGAALRTRGFEAYERSAKGDPANKAAEMAKAKADFLGAIEAFERGLMVIKNAKTTDAAVLANLEANRRNILANAVETYRLVVRTKADVTKAMDAIPIYDQYFIVEKDPALALKARVNLGDILREAGESEPSIAAYRVALEAAPDNADAMAGIGLSLFNLGVIEDDKAKMQEGLNFMQKFADTAPDTHPLKTSVKEAVEYLKTEQKLAPQKAAPARRRT